MIRRPGVLLLNAHALAAAGPFLPVLLGRYAPAADSKQIDASLLLI